MDCPTFCFIGTVNNSILEQQDSGWGEVVSRIELFPDYRAGLDGLEAFSHAIILTYLHQAKFDLSRHLKRHPRGQTIFPKVGLFAQRSKDRPNPIGITVVMIQSVESGVLTVKGLDAIHGTPVLDIKPFFPPFDQPGGEVRLADWG